MRGRSTATKPTWYIGPIINPTVNKIIKNDVGGWVVLATGGKNVPQPADFGVRSNHGQPPTPALVSHLDTMPTPFTARCLRHEEGLSAYAWCTALPPTGKIIRAPASKTFPSQEAPNYSPLARWARWRFALAISSGTKPPSPSPRRTCPAGVAQSAWRT